MRKITRHDHCKLGLDDARKTTKRPEKTHVVAGQEEDGAVETRISPIVLGIRVYDMLAMNR